MRDPRFPILAEAFKKELQSGRAQIEDFGTFYLAVNLYFFGFIFNPRYTIKRRFEVDFFIDNNGCWRELCEGSTALLWLLSRY